MVIHIRKSDARSTIAPKGEKISILVALAGTPVPLARAPRTLTRAPISESLAGQDLLEGRVSGVEVVALGVLWGLGRLAPLESLRMRREILWHGRHVMAGLGSEHAEGEIVDEHGHGEDADDKDLGVVMLAS